MRRDLSILSERTGSTNQQFEEVYPIRICQQRVSSPTNLRFFATHSGLDVSCTIKFFIRVQRPLLADHKERRGGGGKMSLITENVANQLSEIVQSYWLDFYQQENCIDTIKVILL